MDALQYFYYGQLVHHGEPTGEMRVLAKTAGITDEHVELALQHVKLPPLIGSTGVAWGILRTQRGKPLMLGRTDQNTSGLLAYQFVVIPPDTLRQLAGNIRLLAPYFKDPMPTYSMLGDTLKPLPLRHELAPTAREQSDALLELMDYAHDMRTLQTLLSAVVNGTSLIILNAPKDGFARATFIQGLLTMLPSSTRFGVTFLLHTSPESGLTAQIMFMDVPPLDEKATIYNWATGKISGQEINNDYSKFMVSQMMLDLDLVMKETEKLTPTAGWRFNSGDNLAQALDYASQRMRVDQAIKNNLPVEVAMVAKILGEDPTLDEPLRMAYSRHLLNFSLALDDLSHLDAVTPTMHNHPEIEEEVYQQFAMALADDKGSLIFQTLVRWKDNPFSPHGPKWIQLMQTAAMAEVEDLVAQQDTASLSEYLDDVQLLGADAKLMVPRLIDRIAPLADRNDDIPPKLLLLAFQHLEESRINALLKSAHFVRPLPKAVKALLALFNQPERAAPKGVLLAAVESVPEPARPAAMLQFAKMSFVNKRLDLVDERVLKELTTLILDPHYETEKEMIANMALAINDTVLNTLKQPAPRYILQLLLGARRYDVLGRTMIKQARDLYRAEGQQDYIRSILATFAETDLKTPNLAEALDMLAKNGLTGVPLIAAICGSLESSKWAVELRPFARKAMLELEQTQHHLQVIPSAVIINLLRYQVRQGDLKDVRVVAKLVGSSNAYKKGKDGLSATDNAYKLLESNPKTRPLALEVVRQYVREAEEKPAQHMIKFYGDKLGKEVGDKLQVAYEFSNLMGRIDIISYADELQLTVDLLQSVAEAFDKGSKSPDFKVMRQFVEDIRRYVDIPTHRKFAENVRQTAHNIVVLAEQHNRRSSNSERFIEGLAAGTSDPKSILDVYRAAGGYLLEKKVYPLRVKEGNPNAPFGLTDLDDLMHRMEVASNLIHQATTARPTSRDQWSNALLTDDIESQTQALLGDNRNALRQMGRNWQRLTDLILKIHKESDTKVIEQANPIGRKLDIQDAVPKDSMQFFRFVYGFFVH